MSMGLILLGTKQYNKGERAIVNCTQHLLEIERYVVQYGILIKCFFFFVKSRFSKRNGSVQVFANFKYGTILSQVRNHSTSKATLPLIKKGEGGTVSSINVIDTLLGQHYAITQKRTTHKEIPLVDGSFLPNAVYFTYNMGEFPTNF